MDYSISLHQQIHKSEDVPAEFVRKRQDVIDRLQVLMDESKEVVDLFQNQEVISKLRQDRQHNLNFLREAYGFKVEKLESLYRYAKFQFECGDYAAAAELLYHFRILSTDPEKNLSALWGKLAAETLLGNWDTALEDFTALRALIEQRQGAASPLEILQQRTWAVHWGLFIFFNQEKGREQLLEVLLAPAYRQTIQTTCPHILRYLVVAAILTRRRRESLKEVISLIQQEAYNYSDPLTRFMEALFVSFDFDGAQQTLAECRKVMEYDFFLEGFLDAFFQNARHLIFETYCKIHQRIDFSSLAQKLTMERDEAEKWIVDLIRNAQLDAKIDSENNAVTLIQKTQNVYQQVIERTKPLAFRTHVLATSIDKKNAQPAAGQQQGGGQKKERKFDRGGPKRGPSASSSSSSSSSQGHSGHGGQGGQGGQGGSGGGRQQHHQQQQGQQGQRRDK